MLNPVPELRENETVIGEYPATVHQVQGNAVRGSNVRLWLTNQRLILKAALGSQRTLPLYALANFREEKVSIYTLIRFEFSTGMIVWLSVRDQAQFLETLKAAQAQAPIIPEQPMPGSTSRVILAGIGVTAVISALVVICSCLFVAGLVVLWFLARQAH